MTLSSTPQPGRVDLPGPGVYPNGMELLTDPANLPRDRSAIPDDAVINIAVWAKLQGVAESTVHRYRSLGEARRRAEKDHQAAMATYEQHRQEFEAGTRKREPKPPAEPAVGLPKRGDMPAEDTTVGQSPLWTMRTYRAWAAARPGRGQGGGPKPGTARPRPKRHARLPITVTCPCGCGQVITITARDVAEGKVKTGDSRRVVVPAVAEQAPAGELVAAS